MSPASDGRLGRGRRTGGVGARASGIPRFRALPKGSRRFSVAHFRPIDGLVMVGRDLLRKPRPGRPESRRGHALRSWPLPWSFASPEACSGWARRASALGRRRASPDRSRLVADLARYVSETKDLAEVRQEADNAGFVPTQPALDSILLTAFTANREGDANALVALIRADGTVIGTQPPGAPVPSIKSMPATWKSATAGNPAMSSVLRYRGSVAAVKAVPVGGAHPWAVLIEVAQSGQLLSQGFVSNIGSLGLGPGGGALVDPAGRALEAWDPRLLGKTLVSAGASAAPSDRHGNRVDDRRQSPDRRHRGCHRFRLLRVVPATGLGSVLGSSVRAAAWVSGDVPCSRCGSRVAPRAVVVEATDAAAPHVRDSVRSYRTVRTSSW